MGYQIEEKLIRVNNKTRPGRKLKSVKGVVIHWTANEAKGADRMAHYRYFNKGEVYASAHYFVDEEGILRIIPENEMAYHVGAKHYKTNRFGSYPNASTIGIEMCVNEGANFKETYKRAVWLAADIIRRYGLDPDGDLVRHYDVTGKHCPMMFVNDIYAKKYMGMTAAQAYGKFKADVKALLNPQPSKKPDKPTSAPKVEVKPTPQPTSTDYVGKSLKSKVDDLRFYSRPSWEDKDVVGHCTKGVGFPTILDKVKVGNGYQYKVQNSKGAVFYITASSKYVDVVGESKPQPKPQPKPTPSYIGKSVKSKVNHLRFYSKPSWEDKDVVGHCDKGIGFPKILDKVKVGGGYQYKVQNSKGAVFYITASEKYVIVQ